MTKPPDGNSSLTLAGKRILVVEDEFLIALDIESVLESAGTSDIISVSRNRDAIGALQGEPFDLAILDYKLDGELSVPVAERLTEMGVPFIFLTGAMAPSSSPRFAVPFVNKPFDSATLIIAIKKAIERG
jgi:DNA-binding NtrC family response regulator